RPCPNAVNRTPEANSRAELVSKFTISRVMLSARLPKPAAPHQDVGRRAASTWNVADANKIKAMAVPLTTGPCQGTSWSRNNGASDAYSPKTPKARKGRLQVSMNALETLDSGQVSFGRTSCRRKRRPAFGLAVSGRGKRKRASKAKAVNTSVGI